MTTIKFIHHYQHSWSEKKMEALALIDFAFAYGKNNKRDFVVDVKIDKTSKQMRGFHRLLNILAPHLAEWTGEHWDIERVKDFIKKRQGFATRFKGVEVVKSCRKATIEEMMALINETIAFADEMGIEGCFLESYEEQELKRYYGVKDGKSS